MSETIAALIAQVIGAAILPILIGLAVAVYSKRKRNAARMPKGPLIIGGIFAVLLATNSMLQQFAENSRVRVMRFEQPAPGATEADITPDYLQQVSEATLAHLRKVEPESPTTTSTAIIEANGKRFGIIRFTTRGVTPVVAVLGLANGKLIKIICSRGDAFGDLGNVDIRSVECAQALKSDFGITPGG